jgi:ribosomal protein S27E
MGRKLNIFTGIIFLIIGIPLMAMLTYGSLFRMFLVGCAIYLLIISAKSKPKPKFQPKPNASYQGVKCPNCGNLTGTLNSLCPNCGSRLRNFSEKQEKELKDEKELREEQRIKDEIKRLEDKKKQLENEKGD